MKGNFLVIVMVIIALMACKTDSDPDPECNCPVKEHLSSGENCKCGLTNCYCTLIPTCECPNGTLHLIGETCCKGTDCACEKNVTGQRVNGIPVTNQGISNSEFNVMVGRVTTALGYLSGNKKTYIEANIKEIKIVPGTGLIVPAPVGGVLTVENNALADDIYGPLDDWCDINGIS